MIKRIAIALIAFIILLAAGASWFALRSETALRWVVARAEMQYAGKLRIGSVKGSLMGPIILDDVQLDESTFDARIRTLTLEWQPLALLGRRAVINHLLAQDMDVQIKPRKQSAPFKFVRPRPPHLPVNLLINDLEVNHLTLTTPNLNGPVVVDHVALMAMLNNRAWTLRSLQAEGAHVQVRGNGLWAFQHGERVNAHLQWQLTLPEQPAFNGEMDTKGDEQIIQFNGSLSEPFSMQLTAELKQLFSAPSWQGKLRFSGLDPHRLRSNWSELLASGEVNVQGDPHATTLTGDIRTHEPKYGDWRSHVDLRWADRMLQVRNLELAKGNTATRFTLSGQVLYADGKLEPALHGEWRALPLPLTGKPLFVSPRGKLEISAKDEQALLTLAGTFATGGNFSGQGNIGLPAPHAWQLEARARGFQLALEAMNNDQPLPPMSWQLKAHGDESFTLIDRFTTQWLGGQAQARGRIAHGDGQLWQFDITAQNINPATLYPHFPGALDFTARVSGHRAARPAWKFQLVKLSGRLRDTRVQATGTVSHVAGVWQFQNAVAHMGGNSLQFNGRFGKQPQFAWKLDAPDLAALWPDIHGKLVSEGRANLDGAAPVLTLSLDAETFRYREYSFGKITAQVNMGRDAQAGSAMLNAEDVQLKDLKIGSLTAQAAGSLNTHTLTAKFITPYGDGRLAGSGAFASNVWQGDLTELTLMPQGAGEWRNTTAWQPRIAVGHFSLPQACLTQVGARACLDADWQPAQWQADAALTSVPVSALQALLPEGLDYEGSFGARLHMQGTDDSHTFDITASLSPGAVYNLVNQRRVSLLAYNTGNLMLHSDAQATTGQLDWSLKDGGYMDIRSQITHGAQAALSGSIQGETHDFELVPALIPEVGALQGKLKINLTLSGTPMDPLFSGTASLEDGAILIPRLGLHVTNVLLNMNGNGDHLTLNGTARSGNGNLEWQSSAVRTSNVWQTQGKLSGENFRVADIPEARIDISPTLDFKLDNRDVYLNGTVNVPHAKLRPRDLSHTAQVSPDQVIVGANGQPPPEKWRVHAEVRVSTGQDVDFAGFGLTGNIAGSVLAADEPGHYTTGSGELQIVNGQYTAYGQKLKIDRGRLMFNGGPISNPALDIRAIRPPARPETVLPGSSEQVVGVQVRGTLRDPKMSLFSNPPLPQAQLLTYLLTGQAPVNQSQSPLVGAPPTTPASSLALTGGQLLAQEVGQEVGQHVGIQDVGVQNVSTGLGTSAPALFLGRYLSPRLYVSYGVGLLQPINTVRIRYTLSTRWMLEAESGFANSADLIYTIER
ncbi:MAG: translocation/assembly module TamB domain-containing protein [Gammaproteobacteria bacterium]